MSDRDGSLLLTLRTFYHTLRISVPTVLEAMIGRLRPEVCDARLRDWAESLVRITRTQLQVDGQEHIPSEPCIVMSNHQSLSDIPLIFAALPEGLRLRMVAKAELFKVPIWGRAMRLSGFIPIVRSDRARAIESLEQARRDLVRDTYVWIAPEGTRSRSGELGQLKKGGFVLARDAGFSILPIAISGSRNVLPPTGIKCYFDQKAHLRFSAPIATAGRSMEEVMAEVRQAIDPAKL